MDDRVFGPVDFDALQPDDISNEWPQRIAALKSQNAELRQRAEKAEAECERLREQAATCHACGNSNDSCECYGQTWSDPNIANGAELMLVSEAATMREELAARRTYDDTGEEWDAEAAQELIHEIVGFGVGEGPNVYRAAEKRAEKAEAECERLQRSANGWEADAKTYAKNSDDYKTEAAALREELDRIKADYYRTADILAECDSTDVEFATRNRSLEDRLDAALEELSAVKALVDTKSGLLAKARTDRALAEQRLDAALDALEKIYKTANGDGGRTEWLIAIIEPVLRDAGRLDDEGKPDADADVANAVPLSIEETTALLGAESADMPTGTVKAITDMITLPIIEGEHD